MSLSLSVLGTIPWEVSRIQSSHSAAVPPMHFQQLGQIPVPPGPRPVVLLDPRRLVVYIAGEKKNSETLVAQSRKSSSSPCPPRATLFLLENDLQVLKSPYLSDSYPSIRSLRRSTHRAFLQSSASRPNVNLSVSDLRRTHVSLSDSLLSLSLLVFITSLFHSLGDYQPTSITWIS